MPTEIDLTLDQPVLVSPHQINTVAVIGGGASGAIAADSLLQETSGIKNVTLFERRAVLGGVWALDEDTIKTPNHIVKSGHSSYKSDPQLPNPFHTVTGVSEIVLPKPNQERFEETPSYQGLKTNVLEQMMTFSDLKRWPIPGVNDPKDTQFVDGLVVQEYIDTYIKRNSSNERFNLQKDSTIEDVERIPRENLEETDTNLLPYRFRLTVRKHLNESQDLWYQQDFDAVVVAVGHYHVPFIPEVPGLAEIQEKFPEVIEHAKFYRLPESYKDKTVVVVGSRASGADLTNQISPHASKVYQSIRTLSFRSTPGDKIEQKPVILKYSLDSNGFKVHFTDGTEVLNPDTIIYGTGYDFSYPFLNRYTQSKITLDGKIVPDLYQHTFHIDEPLLSFIGVPIDGISFRVFEYQAVLTARYLTGKVKLPSKNEQRKWTAERRELKGITRAYHTIGVLDAIPYLSTLTKLGEVEKVSGRPFPVYSEEDLGALKAATERLKKFWDEM
ncbi:FAD/NAD(P)-binding domain-containing protein [Suhomyces tanzawaensis NRRL Y-17324]|uniref:FAD/NAD(P)-binding domain-containing protein n=1 Tax=Suhomyces tanzawaensis NRRL Y-17324 TaxID=984487 RepID=A0A1E4SR76_9ASCO|nr:FAD/NAD(P)-binding domain-containing protein [Suhomyces tanzawaensis NRRL Y-17324]ODV82001.1 FAD/NAD(P)-binding domain-containing protein [Suhomyces tanzawaensis NRRL Y-17324]